MILVSDYDGTLKRENITEQDIEAVRNFQQQGHLFGLATGRALNYLDDDFIQSGIETDFFIGTNGGIAKVGNDIYRSDIDTETMKELVIFTERYPGTIIFVSDGFDYSFQVTADNLDVVYSRQGERLGAFNAAGVKHQSMDVLMEMYNELLKKTELDLSYHLNNHNGGIIDIAKKGVSKSTMVQKVCMEVLGYPRAEVHVIGNSFNDLPMVEDFNGYSVSDGDNELLQVASRTFPNIESCIQFLLS